MIAKPAKFAGALMSALFCAAPVFAEGAGRFEVVQAGRTPTQLGTQMTEPLGVKIIPGPFQDFEVPLIEGRETLQDLMGFYRVGNGPVPVGSQGHAGYSIFNGGGALGHITSGMRR